MNFNTKRNVGAAVTQSFKISTLRYVLLAAAVCTGGANAVEIKTGNPELEIRFDNNLRYNLGVRAEKQDPAILSSFGDRNSDAKFSQRDVVSNRLDVLSEFDFIYKKNLGFRVSAASWYDAAYRNTSENVGAFGPSYPNGQYSDFTKRYNRGPSGEFLDAFVFGKTEIGDVPVSAKLGAHTVYWGESLFSFVHGVSYGQSPIDIRKAVANPGVGAKEVFRPLNQLSGSAQLTDELTVAGQYYLDWKPSVFPDGGTYYGVKDFVTQGGGTMVAPGFPFTPVFKQPKKRGDWGLMARWNPPALGGTLGFYLRQYTDKLPQLVTANNFTSFGFDFLDKKVTLTGASISKNIGGVSVAAEIAHRANTGLLMNGNTLQGASPTGDTWHALVNAIAYLGKNPFFDSAALTSEATFSRLDKIKTNPDNFSLAGTAACLRGTENGCATKNQAAIAVKFEPTWFQVFPSVDVSMPLFYTKDISGTSPVLFGGYEGAGSYSAGLTFDARAKYNLAISYSDSFAKHDVVNGVATNVGNVGSQWDRGTLSATFKMTF